MLHIIYNKHIHTYNVPIQVINFLVCVIMNYNRDYSTLQKVSPVCIKFDVINFIKSGKRYLMSPIKTE